MLYALAAALLGGVVTVLGRLQVARQRGRRRVAGSLPPGGIIIISNHTSYADGVLLALVCRRLGRSVRLLATAGVFRAPVIGGLVRRLGFIRVERSAATAATAIEAAVAALAAGEAVGIFPEGRLTRHPDHWPERAKTGVVRLALRSGAPIVPVAMVGAHRLMGRSGFVTRALVNVVVRPRVATAVGVPIDIAGWGVDPDDAAQVRAATDRVMAALVELVEQLRGQEAPPDAGLTRTDG